MVAKGKKKKWPYYVSWSKLALVAFFKGLYLLGFENNTDFYDCLDPVFGAERESRLTEAEREGKNGPMVSVHHKAAFDICMLM